MVDYAAMAHALVALGSNLGDRAERLNDALLALTRLPDTRLIRRSRWFETPPIGGPDGQGAFLNGAALLWTSVTPNQLLAALQQIEERLGRVRGERWGARVIDLDLLLFDQQIHGSSSASPGFRPGGVPRTTPQRSAALPPGGARGCTASEPMGELILPHPRMEFRRFVLEPAAAVAPWMIHPTSGWTVQALFEQLVHGANFVAVAAENDAETFEWVKRLRERFPGAPPIAAWDYRQSNANHAGPQRPRLILAFPGDDVANPSAFHVAARSRRMPNLPAGPIAWIPSAGVAEPLVEAAAAIQAVWPELASTVPPSD